MSSRRSEGLFILAALSFEKPASRSHDTQLTPPSRFRPPHARPSHSSVKTLDGVTSAGDQLDSVTKCSLLNRCLKHNLLTSYMPWLASRSRAGPRGCVKSLSPPLLPRTAIGVTCTSGSATRAPCRLRPRLSIHKHHCSEPPSCPAGTEIHRSVVACCSVSLYISSQSSQYFCSIASTVSSAGSPARCKCPEIVPPGMRREPSEAPTMSVAGAPPGPTRLGAPRIVSGTSAASAFIPAADTPRCAS